MPTTIPAWTTRVWLEYRAGNLTRAARDVLLTLHTFRGTGGQCWPSHETLADRARCCTRTVQRALAQAQAIGLVDWAERRVRAGWRWLRSSNMYRFVVPDWGVRPINPAQTVAVSTTGQIARREESLRKKDALSDLLRAAAALP
ncbi:MAG: helix-turn-helix domain-containing protein, partial [Acetobacteraceae bacterium]